MHKWRWLFVAAVALVMVVAVVAGAVALRSPDAADGPGTPQARPLTELEANRLAVTRFRNHTLGAREVAVVVPTPQGPLRLDGSVDFTRHVGYGVLTGGGSGAANLVQWTLASVITRPWTAGRAAPAKPPADGWSGFPLKAEGSSLDSALLIALNLAGDRPENAQLLNQNGAAWLRPDVVDGAEVDVVRGPGVEEDGEAHASRTRFWLAEDGTSVRVEVDLETADEPVGIDLGPKVRPVVAVPGLLTHSR